MDIFSEKTVPTSANRLEPQNPQAPEIKSSLKRAGFEHRLWIALTAVILAATGAGCGNLTLETAPAFTPTSSAQEFSTEDQTSGPSEVLMPSSFRLVGYYASWDVYERSVFLSQILAEKITHINYAFSNISPDGECILGDEDADTMRIFSDRLSVDGKAEAAGGIHGNFRQLMLLKRKYPRLKVLISVGGWTWSGQFSAVAGSENSRERFVQSCLDLYLVRYGATFDGVDIDWEYPVEGGLKTGLPEDRRNYTLLMEEFRRQMDVLAKNTGREYFLTIAGPASPDKMDHFELGEIQKPLDWINLMAYDFHVATEPVTGLHSPLYGSPRDPDPDSRKYLNADAAVRGYLAAGVPAGKIVLGIPFYGRSWSGAAGDGLFATAAEPGPGHGEAGYLDYRDILEGPLKTYQRHWEDTAKEPWLFDSETGTFITYDDAESIRWKAEYIRGKGLGGAMVWELGLDGGTLLQPLGDDLFRE